MLFTFAVMAAVCMVLALAATITNWWFDRTATGTRRAGDPPRPAEPPPPDLPREPGSEDTQQIPIAELPAPRTVHVPEPIDDSSETTANLPQPTPAWPDIQLPDPPRTTWGRPALPAAGADATRALPQPSDQDTQPGTDTDTEQLPAVRAGVAT